MVKIEQRVPIKTNPRLFDKVVAGMQMEIASRIGWLDHIFGLSETVTDVEGGRKMKSANLYIGDQRYERIEPCEELGNFCFFILRDPQERVGNFRNVISAPFSIVFWYNVDKASSSPDSRNREAVKEEILAVLNTFSIPGTDIEWNRVYEKAESVFADFSYDITKNQYMMSPYSGIRIDGTMRGNIACWDKIACGDFNDDFNNDYLIGRACGNAGENKDE